MFSHSVLLIVMCLGGLYGLGTLGYEVFQKKEGRDSLQISLSLVIFLVCSISIYQLL